MLHLAVAINDRNHDLIPFLISLFTWSKAYHTELVFTDGQVLKCDPNGGVRIEPVAGFNRYQWTLVPLPWINWVQEAEIRKRAESIVAAKPEYDWIGALFGGISSSAEDPSKWFCSELCAELIRDYTEGIKNDKKWFSPDRLWKSTTSFLEIFEPRYSEVWKFRYHSK